MDTDNETIRDAIARLSKKCAASAGKSVLVLRSIDTDEVFVPEDEVRLHQDSIEFIDTDGAHTVLPFSRIARVEIDEDEGNYPSFSPPRSGVEDGTGKVVRFRKKRKKSD